jgi:hypothetical protein
MVGVKTYYKPTQMRGKRVVYASIDPAERKKQMIMGYVAISIVLFILIVAFIT